MSPISAAFVLGVVCTTIALLLWWIAHLIHERLVP